MDILPVSAHFEPGPSDGILSADDLSRINQTTVTPYQAEDLYGFACVMATAGLTDYATRLGSSSLSNFAADAQNGVPYHLMHDRQPAPYGYTFRGEYAPGANEARAGVFIPKGRLPAGKDGRTSNQEIADLMAGLRREVSVGFGGALTEWKCDVCGNDVFSMECWHIPGMKMDEGKLATATINNARLVELSGVDRGACPGAVVGKAREMFAQSRFSAKEFAGWCDRVQVPSELRTYSVPASSAGKGKHMNREQLATALAGVGLTVLSAGILQSDDAPEKLAAALATLVTEEVTKRTSEHPLLSQLSAAQITKPEDLQATFKAADFGRNAETKLRANAQSLGVQALGQELAASVKTTVNNLPVDALEPLMETWQATVTAKFGNTATQPATRQTAPGPVPGQPTSADVDDKSKDKAARRRELMAHDPLGKKILEKEATR